MTKTPMSLQDLRRRLDVKAQAAPSWRFWGLSGQVGKRDTLREAYRLAKENHGAPGSDGVTLEAIEADGVETFLQQLQDALVTRTYHPRRWRHKAIPKEGGQGPRILSMPTIRDRVVQGALKRILAPIVEADCQPGSDGYRPKRAAQDAVLRVAEAIVQAKTRVIDGDLHAYGDNLRHHLLWAKVAQRVNDPEVLHGLQLMLQGSGKQGVAPGGVLAPWRRHRSLTAVDQRLERAKEGTRRGPSTSLEEARFADARVILGEASPQHDWRLKAVDKRLREELATLQVARNAEKSRIVDLAQGAQCRFLGLDCRRVRSRQGVWRAWYPPTLKQRTALLRKRKALCRRYPSQPIDRVLALINPIRRGWVRSVAVGDASRCVGCLKAWVDKQVRRHLRRARTRRGFGGKRGRRQWLSQRLGWCNPYRVHRPRLNALPTWEVP